LCFGPSPGLYGVLGVFGLVPGFTVGGVFGFVVGFAAMFYLFK
jgi:hypothetical protein